jgi:hypothetical protein
MTLLKITRYRHGRKYRYRMREYQCRKLTSGEYYVRHSNTYYGYSTKQRCLDIIRAWGGNVREITYPLSTGVYDLEYIEQICLN